MGVSIPFRDLKTHRKPDVMEGIATILAKFQSLIGT